MISLHTHSKLENFISSHIILCAKVKFELTLVLAKMVVFMVVKDSGRSITYFCKVIFVTISVFFGRLVCSLWRPPKSDYELFYGILVREKFDIEIKPVKRKAGLPLSGDTKKS